MRAPTKATGGGGYTFADEVAAGFLVQMLRRAIPLDPEIGPIAEMHFEASDTGQILDDLLLLLKNGNETTRCTISVKSNRQLTKAGFNDEFVQDAWKQWDGVTGSSFNRDTDFLGLIVRVIDNQTLEEWRGLQKQDVATTPERMVQRLADSQQSSATQRAIFQSLHRAWNGGSPDPLETARLASRIRVLPFLEGEAGQCINRCAEVVLDGNLAEGAKLWSRLRQLAADNRGTGGYFDLPKLVRALRPDFELRDYPDFEADWKRIEAVSAENLRGVRSVIGKDIQLARTDQMNAISTEVAVYNTVVIAGESGSGKSAVVSRLVGVGGPFKRALWLSAEQLSKTSQTEVAHSFSLRHSIPELIHNSTLRGCVLVVDGLERFEGDARRRALELIKAVSDENFVGWKLIVTCQPQALESTQDALIEARVTDVRKVDFTKPSSQEIYDVIPHLPEIQTLLYRSQLQPILRNLVILDWVLRTEIVKRLSDPSQGWIGETGLINWVWEWWIGSGAMRIARDSLLRTLGEREGERLSGAAHVDSIPRDQLPLLGTLANEGLIRENLPSIQFQHDLMGDWARFRVLAFARHEAVGKIKAVAHIPRWGRAIHLYAQSLAEHGDGLADWKSVTAQLTGDGPNSQLASDIFLDGLLFATNSESLLEQIWPHLIAENGAILRRLLRRLQHAASVPDVRFRGLVGPEFAEQSEVWFRIPHPLYWYPALRVFSRHSKDMAEHALLLAAEVCALWLRTMPDEMPGRREASLLVLELAKETQGLIAEGMHFGDKDQVVYEALLSAAKEFPEEVTQIALELCARREEPQHVIERALEADERRAKQQEEWRKNHSEEERTKRIPPPVMLSFPRGPMRAPAADGPLRDVSDGFRSAVLETPALNALIAARPEVAKEVLLAVCIDEPKPSDEYERRPPFMERFGIADWRHGYPAFYWKGPFLKFLQDAPQHGLDAIIRLVNYATNRWLEEGLRQSLTAEERRKYEFEFEFDGKTTWWLGDCNVFGWHRYLSMDGACIECALMALEKWLYDEVDNNRSISQWVQYIYEHEDSLAFAGVLTAVGLKHPPLFARELQPLLGNFYIYECQSSWALNERGESWRISLASQGQPTVKLAAEWHRMPHRRVALQDIAQWLMVHDEGTQEYMSARRIEWSKGLERAGQRRDAMELFLATFDPENYVRTPQPDGKVLVEMRLPVALQARIKNAQEEGQLEMLSLTLASLSRQYLSGERTLQPQEVSAFAAQVKRLSNWQASSEDRHLAQCRIDSLAGGIAVLIVQHRGWLSRDPELEEWCIRTLRELKPGENSEHDTPVSALDSTAESFRGEAGVALLLESDKESDLRMTFEGVTGFYYRSTLQTMLRAYLLREQLGEKFGELANIVVLWSALRHAATRESGYQANCTLLAKYKETLFRRYMKGKLKGPPIPLRRAETLGRRLVERISRRTMSNAERRVREAQRKAMHQRRDDRRLHRETPDIDWEVIRKGFGFLAAMVREPLSGEKEILRHYIGELYDLEMRTLPSPEPGEGNYEIEGAPYDFDVWVMERIAEFIVHANSLDVARTFYRPILELGPAASYWVADFLRSWISIGLEMSGDLATFSKIWGDMVRYAMTLPAWQPGDGNYWCRAESLVVDLMGLREAQAAILGRAKYESVVSAMAPVFEEWARLWLKYGSVAAWFARFLPTESGRVFLAQGIKQLAGFVGSFRDRDWHQHGLGVLLTEALAACWKYLRNEVELQPDLRKAFLSILTDLCARPIPEALHLRNKVSEVLGTS
jgi:hypothetical protein